MANETPRTFWTVAVTDGVMRDLEGRYVRDRITYSCGHLHRSMEAAEACHRHLARTRSDGSYNPRWSGSEVLPVDANGVHLPPQEDLDRAEAFDRPRNH